MTNTTGSITRDNISRVSLSADEKARLERAARSKGLSLAAFLRMAALEKLDAASGTQDR